MQDHQSRRSVELWIRSFAPAATGPTQERALERLETIQSLDAIETVDVGVWGAQVEFTDRTRQIPQLQRIRDRLETFEEWAARTDRRLEPYFRRRRVESTITGESHEVRRLPTIALAEFEDGDLVHVAPCSCADRQIDVFDRLDALAELGAAGGGDTAEQAGSADGTSDGVAASVTDSGRQVGDRTSAQPVARGDEPVPREDEYERRAEPSSPAPE